MLRWEVSHGGAGGRLTLEAGILCDYFGEVVLFSLSGPALGTVPKIRSLKSLIESLLF